MTHFHLIAATGQNNALASVRYEKYEDSIETFAKLANTLFKGLQANQDGLAIEHAKDATNNGEGFAAVVGTDTLCLYWIKCAGPCESGTWN